MSIMQEQSISATNPSGVKQSAPTPRHVGRAGKHVRDCCNLQGVGPILICQFELIHS